MRIGIFGGSFDPIHMGHLLLAQWVKEEFSIDELLFIPAFQSPLKNEYGASADDRLQMVKLATADNPDFRVSTIEIEKEEVSYTYDTVLAIKKQYPQDELFLIMGLDSFNQFCHWKNYEELYELVHIILVRRNKGTIKDKSLLSHVSFSDLPEYEISSTMIRKRRQEKKSIRYMVHPLVEEYIRENNIYEAKEIKEET